MKTGAWFKTCVECGCQRPNHSGLCTECEALYRCNDCPACRSKTAVNYPCKKEAGDVLAQMD